MEEIYNDGSYLATNPTWHVEDSPWKAAQILKMLKRNSLEPHTVADVGCGAGEILRQLSGALPGVTRFSGYEVSEHALQLCRRLESERIRFFQKAAPGEDEVFDLLLVIDVLEHVDDPVTFLRKLKARSRHFLFRIPLDLSAQSFLQPAVLQVKRQAYGHVHHFNETTARQFLEAAGYEVVDNFLTYGPINVRRFGAWKSLLMSVKNLVFMLGGRWTARLFDGFSIMILAR